VRVVTSLREFDDLAPIWRDVSEAGGQSSPFASHDWFACCWRSAGRNCPREVWLLEDSAGPVALIPLVRRPRRIRGLPVRAVEFLDSPETPFADFPAAAPLDDVIAVFLSALGNRHDWDVLSLPRLPVHSAALKALESALPGQFPWRVAGRIESPGLSISGTWESFLREKPEPFRTRHQDIEGQIEFGAKVAVEEHRAVDPDGPVFAEFMEVAGNSWHDPRGAATVAAAGTPRFFRELTRRAGANGWLHLWILRRDGQAVATEYQVGADGHRHALRVDVDRSLAGLSPGAYLTGRIIRSLFGSRGVFEYDLRSERHSSQWATSTRETIGLEIYSRSTYGRILHRLQTRIAPLARRWRERSDSCA
jgi:CelD/BcsL family acetyltransferase involved in cellulose biosynthesis